MAGIKLNEALRAEYNRMFQTCVVRQTHTAIVNTLAQKLIANLDRYANVGDPINVPWTFIAVTHNMESSQNFARHLHNGDPLTKRTVQVPAGRPKTGAPPFTWEESAADALLLKKLNTWTDWTIAGTLYKLEEFNGWGYRKFHPDVKSPYLWSFSNHYLAGKYVADGTWSPTARSQQSGAALLLRRMAELGFSGFTDQPVPALDQFPAVVPYAATKPTDAAVIGAARRLQSWLSTHSGIFVQPDGWPGQRTSDAYKAVTGRFLPGDPRG